VKYLSWVKNAAFLKRAALKTSFAQESGSYDANGLINRNPFCHGKPKAFSLKKKGTYLSDSTTD
jgi:hypothetical protein